MIRRMLSTTALTALALAAAPARTQTEAALLTPATSLGEVAVTAQRRAAEPLQQVPLAVTAFPADLIETRRIATTLDVAATVPNMIASSSPGPASANLYTIRGLGSGDALAPRDPAVATFVDGVPLAGQHANAFGLFDVERIEVLRGSQTMRFGRNTNGGAVDVTLRAPADRIAGYFEGGYGSYGRKAFRGSMDIPAGATFAVKLSGYFNDGDGYVRNTTTGERANDDDGAGVRGAFRFDATERLRWTGAVAYIRADGNNLLNFDCDPRAPGSCDGRFATTGLRRSYNAANPSPLAAAGVTGRKANFGLGNHSGTIVTTSTIAWRGDGFTLEAITGVVGTKQKYAFDLSDGRAFPGLRAPNPAATGAGLGGTILVDDAKYDQWSQEIRLGGTLFDGVADFAVGGQYIDADDRVDFADVAALQIRADRTARTSTKAAAGYAEAGVRLAERLRVSGGVRYTDETKRFAITDNRAQCATGGVFCLGPVTAPARQSTRQWSPRADVTYQLPAMLVFASASKGYRVGGWSARAATAADIRAFAPEETWTYEAGVRSEWFDKRLRVNLTGFYADTDDFQASLADATVLPSLVTRNTAGFRNYGVELDLAAMPVTGLSLYANIGYQNARYRPDALVRQQQAACRAELAAGRVPLAESGGIADPASNAVDCAVGIVAANGDLATPVRTPDFTIAGGGSYDFAIPAAGIILQPSAGAVYRSSYETGAANASLYSGSVAAGGGTVFPANPFGGDFITGSRTRAHVVVAGAVAMKTDDGNWIVSVECSNCLDTRFGEASLFNTRYLNPPRRWLVRAKRSL